MLDQLAHYGSQLLSKIEFLLTQTVHSSLNYITCAAVQHTDTCSLVLSCIIVHRRGTVHGETQSEECKME